MKAMLRNTTTFHRSLQLLAGVCFVFALTSCDKIGKPYIGEGWATQKITASFCDDVATNDKKITSFNRCTFPLRTPEGEVVPEGRATTPAALEEGRQQYMHYCYACHGVNGDGKGPSAPGLRPPPRDFRIHSYKFAAVKEGLPNDWDLTRIIKGGLHGSAMLEWDVPDTQLQFILDFIKTIPPPPCDPGTAPVEGTFKDPKELASAQKTYEAQAKKCADLEQRFPNGAPNLWQERFAKDAALFATGKAMKIKLAKGTGAPIYVPEVDPWVGKTDEALQVGKELYHLRAQCVNCHPGYITKQEFATLLKTDNPTFRDDLYYSTVIAAKDNLYGVNIMPPDFTLNPVRSIRKRERDANGEWAQLDQVRELWRLIASGIGGTGMPSWKGSIKDDEIWALAHYVKSLVDLREPENKAARKALNVALENQPPFKAKAPPPPEPEPAPEPKEEGDEGEDEDAAPAKSAAPEASAAPKGSAKPKATPPKANDPAKGKAPGENK